MWHSKAPRKPVAIESKPKRVVGVDDVDIDVIQPMRKRAIRWVRKGVTCVPWADPAWDALHVERVEVGAGHIRTDDDHFIPARHQLIRKRTHTRRHAIDNRVPALRQ